MRILVEHGKHGTDYYDASDDDKLADAAFYILCRNFRDGWYPLPSEAEIQPSGTVVTDEQIEALPSDALKKLARQENSRIWGNLRWNQAQANFYNEVQALIEGVDAGTVDPHQMVALGRGRHERRSPWAWELLRQRKDSEYERVELVETVAIPDAPHA